MPACQQQQSSSLAVTAHTQPAKVEKQRKLFSLKCDEFVLKRSLNTLSTWIHKMIVILLLVLFHEVVHSAAPSPLVFRDLDSKELNTRINLLESPYALVSTAKEAYGLDETSETDVKCSPLLVRITDRASLLNDVERPQVIISGEIHGDERVVRCGIGMHSFACIVVTDMDDPLSYMH